MRGWRIVATMALLTLGGCETLGFGDGGMFDRQAAPAARPIKPRAPDLPPPLPVRTPPPLGELLLPAPSPPAQPLAGPIDLLPAAPKPEPATTMRPDPPAQPSAPEAMPLQPAPPPTADPAPPETAPRPGHGAASFAPCRLRGEIVMATPGDCNQMGGVALQ